MIVTKSLEVVLRYHCRLSNSIIQERAMIISVVPGPGPILQLPQIRNQPDNASEL